MLLEVENLKQHFPIRAGFFGGVVGHVRAVDGVSLYVKPGETLGLVGESGCGKTTIGRTILRLLDPTAGVIRFEGKDITRATGSDLRGIRERMQIVFQDPYSSLNPRMTVRRLIEEGLIIHGRGTKGERADLVEQTLREVGLDPAYMVRYPHEFSGGQRQRISLARAAALKPKFLVLDEPISALDVSIQAQVVNLLADLKQRMGLTYLFISHDLSMVEYISDRVAVMYLGEIVEQAASRDLYRAPLHPYTQALLSSIPNIDPKQRRTRMILQGDVPSPVKPPAGCRFHPRCPLANERCRNEVPATVALDEHTVRCHRVEEALAESPVPTGTTHAEHAQAISARITAQITATRSPVIEVVS
ncbi:MAG: ATP-binding cassette domain-containing protein [Pirellulales bacterium]